MFIEIAPGIKSWKKYIDQIELQSYFEKLTSCPEQSWYSHFNVEAGDMSGYFLDGKLSLDLVERTLHDRLITEFATENLWIYCHGNFLRLKSGESSNIEDSATKWLTGYKPFVQSKIALYINDFEGGEIVFPKIEFEYKPEAGELLVIDIDENLEHYTKPVISEIRYVYMDYIIQHPGYFMP